jgi:hypothetical protein
MQQDRLRRQGDVQATARVRGALAHPRHKLNQTRGDHGAVDRDLAEMNPLPIEQFFKLYPNHRQVLSYNAKLKDLYKDMKIEKHGQRKDRLDLLAGGRKRALSLDSAVEMIFPKMDPLHAEPDPSRPFRA